MCCLGDFSLKITVEIKETHDFYDVTLHYDVALQLTSSYCSLRVIPMNEIRF